MGIDTTIPNDSHLLKEVSRELLEYLKREGLEDEKVFDVHVSFEEALRNAMIHGNKMDPGKSVKVKADISGSRIEITIEDEGPGFDPSVVPDPTLDENLLKEGGRGVYLMKYLMDEVRYENGGRKVVMVKYFNDKKA